jgi:DNA-directed RNA polymerase specialized sigma24 family protein
LRSKWRKEKLYAQSHLHLGEEEWNTIKDQAESGIYTNWMEHLLQFAQHLSPPHQKLLQLKMEAKSNQEIALLTGKTLNGVKSSFSRVKNKLRELAKDHQVEELVWYQRA